MILSLSFQAQLFVTTLIWGFGLAFLYDLIRVIRIAVKHGRLFVAIEDILYWISVSITIFFVMLSESFGEVRAFCVFGVFLGMFFYSFALSRLFLGVSEIVIRFIKKVIGIVFEIIMTPFRLLMKLFYKPAKKTYNFTHKAYKKLLHLCKVYAKIYIGKFKRNRLALRKKKD